MTFTLTPPATWFRIDPYNGRIEPVPDVVRHSAHSVWAIQANGVACRHPRREVHPSEGEARQALARAMARRHAELVLAAGEARRTLEDHEGYMRAAGLTPPPRPR